MRYLFIRIPDELAARENFSQLNSDLAYGGRRSVVLHLYFYYTVAKCVKMAKRKNKPFLDSDASSESDMDSVS